MWSKPEAVGKAKERWRRSKRSEGQKQVLLEEPRGSNRLCSSGQPQPRGRHRKEISIRGQGRKFRTGQKLPLTREG